MKQILNETGRASRFFIRKTGWRKERMINKERGNKANDEKKKIYRMK